MQWHYIIAHSHGDEDASKTQNCGGLELICLTPFIPFSASDFRNPNADYRYNKTQQITQYYEYDGWSITMGALEG